MGPHKNHSTSPGHLRSPSRSLTSWSRTHRHFFSKQSDLPHPQVPVQEIVGRGRSEYRPNDVYRPGVEPEGVSARRVDGRLAHDAVVGGPRGQDIPLASPPTSSYPLTLTWCRNFATKKWVRDSSCRFCLSVTSRCTTSGPSSNWNSTTKPIQWGPDFQPVKPYPHPCPIWGLERKKDRKSSKTRTRGYTGTSTSNIHYRTGGFRCSS